MQVFFEKFFGHFSMIKAEFTLTFDNYSEWQKVLLVPAVLTCPSLLLFAAYS
jgi:hypothetical protein